MSKDRKPINEGYQPELLKKGYQPEAPKPTGDPNPQGGYQPSSAGDNPANQPTSAPGDE